MFNMRITIKAQVWVWIYILWFTVNKHEHAYRWKIPLFFHPYLVILVGVLNVLRYEADTLHRLQHFGRERLGEDILGICNVDKLPVKYLTTKLSALEFTATVRWAHVVAILSESSGKVAHAAVPTEVNWNLK